MSAASGSDGSTNSRVALITGASSGIGRALAISAARRGVRSVLAGRNEDALANVVREVEAAGGEARAFAGDVTKDSYRLALVDFARSAYGRLDVLLNNAGRGYYAKVADVAAGELEELFALNVIAPLRLSQIALPALTEAKGAIVMVSSVAGVVAAPTMGAYAASKFALEAIAMSLRAEVAADGVRVLVVRPGPVETPFRDNSLAHLPAGQSAGVRPKGSNPQSPEVVAERTWRALDKGAAVLETSLFVRVASFASRQAPPLMRTISQRMARGK